MRGRRVREGVSYVLVTGLTLAVPSATSVGQGASGSVEPIGEIDFSVIPSDVSMVGSEITLDGNVSINQSLTVGGEVAAVAGGFRFPDATIQITAVPTSIADGIAWDEVSQVPPGFQDGIDDVEDSDSNPLNEAIDEITVSNGILSVVEGGVLHQVALGSQVTCPTVRFVMLMKDESRNDCDQPVSIAANETVEVVYRQAINASGTDVVFTGPDWEWSFDQSSLGLPGAAFKGPLDFQISECGQSVVITYRITTECE